MRTITASFVSVLELDSLRKEAGKSRLNTPEAKKKFQNYLIEYIDKPLSQFNHEIGEHASESYIKLNQFGQSLEQVIKIINNLMDILSNGVQIEGWDRKYKALHSERILNKWHENLRQFKDSLEKQYKRRFKEYIFNATDVANTGEQLSNLCSDLLNKYIDPILNWTPQPEKPIETPLDTQKQIPGAIPSTTPGTTPAVGTATPAQPVSV